MDWFWKKTSYLWPSNLESALQFYKSDVFFSKFPEWKEIMLRHSNEDLVHNYVTNYCESGLNRWNVFERSPFFHAVKSGDPESIKFIKLVIDDQSINLNEVDQDGGNTIFHYIINDFEMMKLFTERLEMNSEALKIQNSELETPIDRLEFKNAQKFFAKFPEWREILLDLSQDYEDFCVVIEYIKSYWYSKDDYNHNSPIFHAVNQVKNVKYASKMPSTPSIKLIALIAHHKLINLYEVDTKDVQNTIFHIISNGPIPIVWQFFRERLEEDPKLLNVQNSWKETPIDYLIRNQWFKSLEFLLSKEHFDEVFDFQDIKGQTYLHKAINAKLVNVARLLSKKINVKKQDHKGRTALHLACLSNVYEAVLFLIEKEETDINAKDQEGKTALHYACKTSSSEIITLFLTYHEERNIHLSERDDKGEEPIHILSMREKSNNEQLNEVFFNLMTARAQINCTLDPPEKAESQGVENTDDLEYIYGTDESSESDESS